MTKEVFLQALVESDSGKEYLDLISLCQSRKIKPEPGFEIHHILPRCLGGTNNSENLVKVTVFEHCQLHALLAKAVPCYKTLQPIVLLSNGQVRKLEDLEKITLEEQYQWSKLRYRALHLPKTRELIEKNRQGHLGKKLSPEHIEKRSAYRRNTVTVTDGNITKYILKEDLQEYLDQGWKRGISEERRKRLKESHIGVVTSAGRICVHKGEKERKVTLEELDRFLAEGWVRGRRASFNSKRREFFQKRGDQRGTRIRIRKDGVGKIVPKEELNDYLLNGWEIGMIKSKNIPLP